LSGGFLVELVLVEVVVTMEVIHVAWAVKNPASFDRELVLLIDVLTLASIQQCSQAGFVTH
jgi:hypothetical protein